MTRHQCVDLFYDGHACYSKLRNANSHIFSAPQGHPYRQSTSTARIVFVFEPPPDHRLDHRPNHENALGYEVSNSGTCLARLCRNRGSARTSVRLAAVHIGEVRVQAADFGKGTRTTAPLCRNLIHSLRSCSHQGFHRDLPQWFRFLSSPSSF